MKGAQELRCPLATCAGADVELGLVALEISTGDVLYSQFRCVAECGHTAAA